MGYGKEHYQRIPEKVTSHTVSLSKALDQRLDIRVAQLLDTQQLIVGLLPGVSVALAPDGRIDEFHDKDVGVRLVAGERGPGFLELLVDGGLAPLPLVAGRPLADLGELLERRRRRLDVDGPVLGLLGVLEDAGDGLADGRQGGGAEAAVAAVVQDDAAGLGVGDPADPQAPVEEAAVDDEGVGQAAGLGLLLQHILDGNLVLEHGELGGLGVHCVGAEL